MENVSIEAPVFNACTGKSTALLELADTIAGLLQTKPQIRFEAARKGDIRHSLGSPDAAAAALAIQAETALETGLGRLLASVALLK